MWGTWWVWDARLTSVAILFIYLIIIFLDKTFENIEVRENYSYIYINWISKSSNYQVFC